MLNQLTTWQLAAKLARREVSARQAMQACLDQIQRVDGRLRAFLSPAMPPTPWPRPTRPTRPWPPARPASPLLGVPIAIKDVIAVRGQPLNCGSKILGNSFRLTAPRWWKN
jgi:aspartyl-tRNA(Asn)/glutamyl-tRNA(Gln) amidotransferase subunit A